MVRLPTENWLHSTNLESGIVVGWSKCLLFMLIDAAVGGVLKEDVQLRYEWKLEEERQTDRKMGRVRDEGTEGEIKYLFENMGRSKENFVKRLYTYIGKKTAWTVNNAISYYIPYYKMLRVIDHAVGGITSNPFIIIANMNQMEEQRHVYQH